MYVPAAHYVPTFHEGVRRAEDHLLRGMYLIEAPRRPDGTRKMAIQQVRRGVRILQTTSRRGVPRYDRAAFNAALQSAQQALAALTGPQTGALRNLGRAAAHLRFIDTGYAGVW